jgi:hypothetical protein
MVIAAAGCATGAAAYGASTQGKVSFYRTTTVTVSLATASTFNSAVELLLQSEDIMITVLDEASNRCRATFGERTLTLWVVELQPDRCRLSVMAGGGRDPDANERLTRELVQRICERLGVACK